MLLVACGCCEQHSLQVSSESSWVITYKAVCIAADNNYSSEEQWNIEFMQTAEIYQCLYHCFILDYSTQDVADKL
jgi:hypothetical protein